MTRLSQFSLILLQILSYRNSFASTETSEIPTKVRDLESYGINQNIVLRAFADEIQLSLDEIVRFKRHAEADIIDITTSDGRFRSIHKENEQPRNITAGRIEFLLSPKRGS